MNRKQRLLTLVALAAFGAIIFFHYVANRLPWAEMRVMSNDDISIERGYGNTVTILDVSPERDYRGGNFYKAKVEGPGPRLHVAPPIKDVRMPLFVLAVFYAGLLFVVKPVKP